MVPEESGSAVGPEESGSAVGPEESGSALGTEAAAEFGGTPLKRKRATQKNTTNPLSASRSKPVEAAKKRSRKPPAQSSVSG